MADEYEKELTKAYANGGIISDVECQESMESLFVRFEADQAKRVLEAIDKWLKQQKTIE